MKNMKPDFTKRSRFSRRAFTLTELLVVIAIMGIIAGFTIPVIKSVKRTQHLKTVRAELDHLETALENYKAQYGVYPPANQNAASAGYQPAQLSQLYYELSGTTMGGGNFVILDGSASIPTNSVTTAYGVAGFINCTHGGGQDAAPAKNFLSGLSSKEIYNSVTNNGVPTTVLVTSVGGPDTTYQPLGVSGLNRWISKMCAKDRGYRR